MGVVKVSIGTSDYVSFSFDTITLFVTCYVKSTSFRRKAYEVLTLNILTLPPVSEIIHPCQYSIQR